MRRLRRWLTTLLVLAGLLFVAKHFLFDTAVAPEGTYLIDMDALHKAATASGAPLPLRIEVEHIGDFAFPRALVVAGQGFALHPMILLSHRVVWPDRSVIIDTAMSPKEGTALPGAQIHSDAYERMEKALPKAESIVLTHEHEDHIGGIAAAPNFAAIANKVIITREQLNGPKLERASFAPGTLEQLKPVEYVGLHSFAPGIVLQKAPGHTPGTQLIYVELASGARYLFVGDIAWSEDNITLQRGRPLLATLLMKEDRAAVAAELVALAHLPKDVHLVVAHDHRAFDRDMKLGLFKAGFSD